MRQNRLKIRIISVGKLKETFYNDGVQEYVKRLRPYVNIELLDGLEEKSFSKTGKEEITRQMDKEAERILKLLDMEETLAVLDSKGQQLSSEQLALQIQKWRLNGKSRINFVIGSAFGLSEMIKKRADFHLSISPLTFPHQMAALILTEQIYRSYKILTGEPYHH